MRIRTDDEVYRVDSVWLGPPKATFPWRARYSAYAIGLVVFIVLMALERQVGIPFGFFSTAWALLLAVILTRVIGKRMNTDRPLTHFLGSFLAEINTPRRRTTPEGGAAPDTRRLRVHPTRPRPAHRARSTDDTGPDAPIREGKETST